MTKVATLTSAPCRPLRFGVQLEGTGGDLIDRIHRCESYGFDTILMPDHLHGQLAPFVALGAAAACTKPATTLGTLVLAAPLRQPPTLASEVASLQRISGGRFELGIGAGWLTDDFVGSGVEMLQAGERIRIVESTLDELERCFADDVLGFGEVELPKLCIGGGGRRILELGARRADIVAVNANLARGSDPKVVGNDLVEARVAGKVAWVLDAADHRADRIELSGLLAICKLTSAAEAVAEKLAVPMGITGEELLASPAVALGDAAQITEHLFAVRDRVGVSYFVVPERSAARFVAVIENVHAVERGHEEVVA